MVHENSLKNLKPVQAGTEEAKELASKGGSISSDRKSLARKLDWLKRKGVSDDQAQELYDMLMDKDTSDITLLDYIKTLKEMADEKQDFNQIKATIDLLLRWRKERFGDKVTVDGNINVNWGEDVDKILTACNKKNIVDAEFTEIGSENNEEGDN